METDSLMNYDKFAEDVREFLDSELTKELRHAGRWMTSVYADHDASDEWQKILHKKGWVAPAWPEKYGGCGWDVRQRYIFMRELILAGAPPLSPMGISMCGPALIGHGSEEQKAHYLPKILSGEHLWCQGYSEPQSGSDLASLAMRAQRDGDELVCTGTKIWTTSAHVANWIFCLVRTGNFDRPQLGITFLLIPMDLPGIEVRPIIMTSGEHIQNQIFFDEVRVPIANVVGEIDDGWTVAKYLLEFERGGDAYAPHLVVALKRINEMAAKTGLDRNADFRRKLTLVQTQIEVFDSYEWMAIAGAEGNSPGTSGSVMKILGTELNQHLTELALEAAGPDAMAFQPRFSAPGGSNHLPQGNSDLIGSLSASVAPLKYFNDRAGTIYAGSTEVQKNIIAKAQLGL